MDPDLKKEEDTQKLLAERFANNVKKKPGRPPKAVKNNSEKEMWFEVVKILATNLQVVHPSKFKQVFEYADEFMLQLKDHLKAKE